MSKSSTGPRSRQTEQKPEIYERWKTDERPEKLVYLQFRTWRETFCLEKGNNKTGQLLWAYTEPDTNHQWKRVLTKSPCDSGHTIKWGFPSGSGSKDSACSAGDLGLIPDQEDPLEKGMMTHSSVLAWRIPWTGVWWATVHAVAESWTRLSY